MGVATHSLIRNIEPDTRELVAYVVARARERRMTLNRTRLVKLLYLGEPLGLNLSADALNALVEWFVAVASDRRPDDSLILEYRSQQLCAG
jgi:hypothetical protein